MKEDILEQIVEDYLRCKGYFTVTNVKYRPDKCDPDYKKKSDCVYSDIDIIGVNTKDRTHESIIAVSCKSWQGGFRPEWEIENIKKNKKVYGRESKLRYRELALKKWALAYRRKIQELTGKTTFTYAIAATVVNGDSTAWVENKDFKQMLTPHLKVIALKHIFNEISQDITTTPAPSTIGRLIQVLKSAKCITP